VLEDYFNTLQKSIMGVSVEFGKHNCGRLKFQSVPATAIIVSVYLTQPTSCSLSTKHKYTVVTVSDQHNSTHTWLMWHDAEPHIITTIYVGNYVPVSNEKCFPTGWQHIFCGRVPWRGFLEVWNRSSTILRHEPREQNRPHDRCLPSCDQMHLP